MPKHLLKRFRDHAPQKTALHERITKWQVENGIYGNTVCLCGPDVFRHHKDVLPISSARSEIHFVEKEVEDYNCYLVPQAKQIEDSRLHIHNENVFNFIHNYSKLMANMDLDFCERFSTLKDNLMDTLRYVIYERKIKFLDGGSNINLCFSMRDPDWDTSIPYRIACNLAAWLNHWHVSMGESLIKPYRDGAPMMECCFHIRTTNPVKREI